MKPTQEILLVFRWDGENLSHKVSLSSNQQTNFWALLPQEAAGQLAQSGITPNAFNEVIWEAYAEARQFFDAQVAVPVRLELGGPSARARSLTRLLIPDAYTFGVWKKSHQVAPYSLQWKVRR